MRFSVVVYTEHDVKSLAETLQAIADQRDLTAPAEVIVVDRDADADRRRVAQTFGAIYLVPKSLDRASAWNEGVQAAKGDYLAFTDDDCRPTLDWLASYQRQLSAGFVMLGGPDEVPPNAPRFLRYLDYVLTGFSGSAGLRTTNKMGDAYYPRHWNMIVERRILLNMGGFNDELPDAVELDVANRIRSAGHAVGFVPGAKVLHQRETDLRGFLTRNIVLARTRARLPNRRLIYALPATMLGVGLALLLTAAFSSVAATILAVLCSGYAILVVGSGMHSALKQRDPIALPSVAMLIFFQHLTHGIGYGFGILANGFLQFRRAVRYIGRSSGT